jgi:hypothetical protein
VVAPACAPEPAGDPLAERSRFLPRPVNAGPIHRPTVDRRGHARVAAQQVEAQAHVGVRVRARGRGAQQVAFPEERGDGGGHAQGAAGPRPDRAVERGCAQEHVREARVQAGATPWRARGR